MGQDVMLNNGNKIPSATVIWAAGIKGNVPDGIDQSLIASGNRIKTDRHCQVEGYDNIYAIGDLAYMETPKYPTDIRRWRRWPCSRPQCWLKI